MSSKSTTTNQLENQEYLEIKSVSLEWKLQNLKSIFESSKGDTKSKCVKSAFFGETKWQVFFYPNSGHEQYCSLYLSCQPTAEEFERAAISQLTTHSLSSTTNPTNSHTSSNNTSQHLKSIDPSQVPWHREGLFKFTFEIKSLDRRTTYKTMEANDHAFSHEARNWGWAQYWRRNDAYYSNPSAKYNDAFLICCTIVYSPTPPVAQPSTQVIKKSIPLDLLEAYSSLFNDPLYSDICFKIIRRRTRPPTNAPGSRKRLSTCVVRRLYASKKILMRRSEYFSDMFCSGFSESRPPVTSDPTSEIVREKSYTERIGHDLHAAWSYDDYDDLMDEDSDDLDDDELDAEEESGEAEEPDEEDELEIGSQVTQEELADTPLRNEPPLRSADERWGGCDRPAQANVSVEEPVDVLTSDEVVDEHAVPALDFDFPSPVDPPAEPAPQSLTSAIQTPMCSHTMSTSSSKTSSPIRPSLSSAPLSQDGRPTPKTHRQACCSDRPQAEQGRKKSQASSKPAKKQAGQRPSNGMTVIEVTDAAYTTFKALLFFLYTDTISFAPLSSTYQCLKDEAAKTGVTFGYSSRKEYAKAMVAKVAVYGNGGQQVVGGVPMMDGSLICSAKAIYRLADKLNLMDLKARAYEHITQSLSVQNIPMEVFSSFTAAFEEIRKVEVSYMLRHWNEVRDGPSMKKVLGLLSEGGKMCAGFSEVWGALLSNLEYKPKPSDAGMVIAGSGSGGHLGGEGGRVAGSGGGSHSQDTQIEVLPYNNNAAGGGGAGGGQEAVN